MSETLKPCWCGAKPRVSNENAGSFVCCPNENAHNPMYTPEVWDKTADATTRAWNAMMTEPARFSPDAGIVSQRNLTAAIDGLRSEVVAALRGAETINPKYAFWKAADFLAKKSEPEVELPTRAEWLDIEHTYSADSHLAKLARAILDGKVKIERVR